MSEVNNQEIPSKPEPQTVPEKSKEEPKMAESEKNAKEEETVKESVRKMMAEITTENFSQNIQKVRKFKNEGNLEMSLDMLDAMIKKGTSLFEEFDVRLAEPYFRLGDVLLQDLENRNDLFGNIPKKNGSANGQNKEELSTRDQEIQVSWENMEIARVILEKYLKKEGQEMKDVKKYSLMLADIFKRLGECENLKENFTKAKEEMLKGIKILEEVENIQTSRLLSEFYFLISRTVAYEGKPGHAKEAKMFIEKAIVIISKLSENEQNSNELKKELESIMTIMKNKRDDLKEEIESTSPINPEQIKKAISSTKFATATSFPKSQLKSSKINKLGVFGKGQEITSKQLADKSLETPKDLPKAIKKVQMEAPEQST